MFAQALADWQAAQTDWRAALQAIPVEKTDIPGVCGAWDIKQIVAHLAGWQREAYTHWQHRNPRHLPDYDIDDFNAKSVSALSLLNWYETLDTFRFTCEDMAAEAAKVDEATAADYPLYAEWLSELAKDIRAHHAEIDTWLKG